MSTPEFLSQTSVVGVRIRTTCRSPSRSAAQAQAARMGMMSLRGGEPSRHLSRVANLVKAGELGVHVGTWSQKRDVQCEQASLPRVLRIENGELTVSPIIPTGLGVPIAGPPGASPCNIDEEMRRRRQELSFISTTAFYGKRRAGIMRRHWWERTDPREG